MPKTYISVNIVDDLEMTKLNKKYRGKAYATDVLSFDVKEDQVGDVFYLGDIVINADQARRQAKEYGNSYEEEVSELAAHGILHLLGVHHDAEN